METVFYLYPPRGGRPACAALHADAEIISIHALREEGDRSSAGIRPRSPNFYPRPPRGGRPTSSAAASARREISIHALREEGDCCYQAGQDSVLISIHALREEGDGHSGAVLRGDTDFYPRPPRGGRQFSTTTSKRSERISIHALREEGDASALTALLTVKNFYPRPPRGGQPGALRTPWGPWNFYPRPPRGGRPAMNADVTGTFVFLSTPSARRATGAAGQYAQCPEHFYPRPPRGGRPTHCPR